MRDDRVWGCRQILNYLTHDNREAWLADRTIGIGASEAAVIMGCSSWQNASQLWEIKRGIRKAKNLDDVEYVQEGQKAEPIIRAMFELRHPQYKLTYRPYDMLFQTERPWLYATLDGELEEIETGRKGILEIKRHEMGSRADRAEWNGKVPDHYFCQLCHQFLASGFDFAFLYAALLYPDDSVSLKPYYFERVDCEDSMDAVLTAETAFWESVQQGRMPATQLRL